MPSKTTGTKLTTAQKDFIQRFADNNTDSIWVGSQSQRRIAWNLQDKGIVSTHGGDWYHLTDFGFMYLEKKLK